MAKSESISELVNFINRSPSPFHAVKTSVQMLKEAGGVALQEQDTWNLKPGALYYLTRNDSSLAAFKTPPNWKNKISFSIIAAHTDSPCLKLKPHSKAPVQNYNQWGVEVYGGALFNSWLDRDLGISGRVTYQSPKGIKSKLITLDSKKIRIPQLAIHLDPHVNDTGLKLNPQTHLTPILSLGALTEKKLKSELFKPLKKGGINIENILAFDLYLHDTLPATIGGLNDEFVYAPRLDNLAMCHSALKAFTAIKKTASLPVVFLFDNEEVGSGSSQGGDSNFLPNVLERIQLTAGHSREEHLASLARSFMISADMAHAIHPNYIEKHDYDHMPLIGEGPVIKGNAKLRYATQSETSAQFIELCKKAGVPFQQFVNRSDLACGTTLGPILSTLAGVPTVDVGNPMLSMHSAREMAGSADHGMMIKVMQEFFKK